jgi:hypothetical protein
MLHSKCKSGNIVFHMDECASVNARNVGVFNNLAASKFLGQGRGYTFANSEKEQIC